MSFVWGAILEMMVYVAAAAVGWLIAFGVAVAVVGCRRRTAPTAPVGMGVWLIGAAGAIGTCSGAMIGASRAPVVGDVLPVLLAGAGAAAAMAIAAKQLERQFALVGAAIAFAMSCIAGAVLGAAKREYILNSPAAINHRATLVAQCLVEEDRARQILFVQGLDNPKVTLECEKYPIR